MPEAFRAAALAQLNADGEFDRWRSSDLQSMRGMRTESEISNDADSGSPTSHPGVFSRTGPAGEAESRRAVGIDPVILGDGQSAGSAGSSSLTAAASLLRSARASPWTFGEVALFGQDPFVVDVDENCTGETDDALFIGEIGWLGHCPALRVDGANRHPHAHAKSGRCLWSRL